MAARRGAVATLCLVQFVDVLGVTVVVTALPSMLRDLGARSSAATPIVTGYAMCFGGLLMLGARLGDRYGHRRMLVAGLVIFGAGSVLAGEAPSVAALAAARGLQGAAAACSVPAALRLVSSVTTDEGARRRALAVWSATGAAAGASGLLLGGLLTNLTGWRTVFWFNVPLSVALIIAVRGTVSPSSERVLGRLDLLGSALLTGAVMGLVLGAALLEQSRRRMVGALLVAAGALLLALFARAERAAADPLLPARAVRNPRLRTATAASWLNTATTSSAVTLATLYLQDTRGASPAAAGVALLPFSLGVVATSALAARYGPRRDPKAGLVAGLSLIAAGDALLLALPAAQWLLSVCVGIAGAGIGLSSVAATTIGTDVPDELSGTAAGVLNTGAQLGTALGVAAVLLIATTTARVHFVVAGTPLGWATAAVAAAGGALVVHTRFRHRRVGFGVPVHAR